MGGDGGSMGGFEFLDGSEPYGAVSLRLFLTYGALTYGNLRRISFAVGYAVCWVRRMVGYPLTKPSLS
jgi:hypothetical protein